MTLDAVHAAMAGCEAVYHLAAMANINDAIDRPREAVEVNIMGTVNMLEAARMHQRQALRVLELNLCLFQRRFFLSHDKAGVRAPSA